MHTFITFYDEISHKNSKMTHYHSVFLSCSVFVNSHLTLYIIPQTLLIYLLLHLPVFMLGIQDCYIYLIYLPTWVNMFLLVWVNIIVYIIV